MSHNYYSTACYHNHHEYCKSHTGLSGKKRPSQCKFCEAKCQCLCHVMTGAMKLKEGHADS